MESIQLESVEPQENRARYYNVLVSPTLWGTWALLSRWGRIGQRARGVRIKEFSTQEEAVQHAGRVVKLRMRHKYSVKHAD